MKSALDPAFLRRIRFVVQFPFPDATERTEIWRRMFPADHADRGTGHRQARPAQRDRRHDPQHRAQRGVPRRGRRHAGPDDQPAGCRTERVRQAGKNAHRPGDCRMGAPMNIELEIDELVLHGVAPTDRVAVGEAVQHELTRLLTERGVPPSLEQRRQRQRTSRRRHSPAPRRATSNGRPASGHRGLWIVGDEVTQLQTQARPAPTTRAGTQAAPPRCCSASVPAVDRRVSPGNARSARGKRCRARMSGGYRRSSRSARQAIDMNTKPIEWQTRFSPRVRRNGGSRRRVLRMPDDDRRAGDTCDVPQIVHGVLESSGQALDHASRNFFEPRFGHDFSSIRVHADSRAADSARAVDARAYTVGHHIVFGAEDTRRQPQLAGGCSRMS